MNNLPTILSSIALVFTTVAGLAAAAGDDESCPGADPHVLGACKWVVIAGTYMTEAAAEAGRIKVAATVQEKLKVVLSNAFQHHMKYGYWLIVSPDYSSKASALSVMADLKTMVPDAYIVRRFVIEDE